MANFWPSWGFSKFRSRLEFSSAFCTTFQMQNWFSKRECRSQHWSDVKIQWVRYFDYMGDKLFIRQSINYLGNIHLRLLILRQHLWPPERAVGQLQLAVVPIRSMGWCHHHRRHHRLRQGCRRRIVRGSRRHRHHHRLLNEIKYQHIRLINLWFNLVYDVFLAQKQLITAH